MSSEAATAVLRVADAIGALMEFWGFRRNMGRLWCILYLENAPLSAADLCERLSLSTGAVSMTLSDLAKWGVVKKAWVPGERRDYYEAETNIWKMVSRVFRERELTHIAAAMESFDAALEVLERDRSRVPRREAERIDFIATRIRGLKTLAEIGRQLLGAILSGKAIDAAPIIGFGDGS